MLKVSFLFALICFAFLAVFFTGLPRLRTCQISRTIDDSEEPADKKCRVLLLVVVIMYSFLTFWNLGNRTSPQTFVSMEGKQVILEMRDSQKAFEMVIFPGVGIGEYRIEYSDDADGWFPCANFTQDHVSVLKWQYIELPLPGPCRFLRLVCDTGNPWIGEIALIDTDGNRLQTECSLSQLCDEPNTVPPSSTFLNSSYFDEIYHARTAWEHLNGIWPYEISHPPLGKELLSLGILLFGMTPFGWRFSGTVTGILMLPLMYLLLTRLFRSEKISLCGTILLSAGFMHYVQTRIATIDSYAVFFILLMYYFMAGWFFDGSKKDLALCGICFGLGASCKWTCLYAGAGLAVLWILYWVYAFADLKGCVSSAEDDAANAEQNRRYRESIRRTAVRFFRNAGFCVLFFVLIPGFIYYLSYYPYGQAQHEVLFGREYNRIVLDNQTFMFHYHSTIEAEHPYSSRWYQWILNIRPILYYLEYLPDNKRVSIAAFVNPVICWGGLLSLPILAYAAVKQKEKKAVFLLIGYASGLLPWIFISRLTFEYHYFASAVFLVPILCYVFCLIGRCNPHGRSYIACFTAMAVVLFALFFPVLAGIPVDNEIGTKIFCWLPSWPI